MRHESTVTNYSIVCKEWAVISGLTVRMIVYAIPGAAMLLFEIGSILWTTNGMWATDIIFTVFGVLLILAWLIFGAMKIDGRGLKEYLTDKYLKKRMEVRTNEEIISVLAPANVERLLWKILDETK